MVRGSIGAGANSGSDELNRRAQEFAKRREFERGTNEAAQTRIDGQFGQAFDLSFDVGGLNANFAEVMFGDAGENGDAEDQGRINSQLARGFVSRGNSGFHHGSAAAGMDGEHLDVQARGGGHGFGDGVRDVVKFEVEENGSTGPPNLANDVGSGAGEEFAADFESSDVRRELGDESQGAIGARNVEGDDDRIRHEVKGGRRFAE